MPRARVIQNAFNAGALDPRLASRSDVQQYHQGAKQLTNVVNLPQGGVARRPGLKYVATVPGQTRLASFEFNTTQTYLIVFTDVKIRIYQDGVLLTFLDAPWLEAELGDLKITQSADTMIICHEDHAPQKLFRTDGSGTLGTDPFGTTSGLKTVSVSHPDHGLTNGGSVTLAGATGPVGGIPASELNATHTVTVTSSDAYSILVTTAATSTTTGGGSAVTWSSSLRFTLPLVAFTNIPLHNFSDSLTPATTNEIQKLTFSGTWAAGDTFKLRVGGVETSTIAFAADNTTMAENMRDALQTASSTAASNSIDVDYVPASSPEEFTVEFYGDDGNKDWDPIVFLPVAVAGGGTIVVSEQQKGASGQEAVWSATRGWPRSVTFHEARLWFGGAKSRPSSLWGSKTGDFFNFDVGDALDDEAIAVTLDTNELNAIQHVFSGRHLQVLTTGGEFYVPERPITPTTISIPRQSLNGSSSVSPISIDGATLFVQRNGRSVREFLFNFTEDAYVATEISTLAAHLIKTPVDMAVELGVDGDYVYVVNTDGTMAVLNVNRAQGIAAWVEFTTNGTFERVVEVGDKIYVVVKRTINSNVTRYLEVFDSTFYTDAGVQQTGSQQETWGALAHLEGELVKVRGDAMALQDQTVSGSAITIEIPVDAIEVGLGYTATVIPMPVATEAQTGSMLNRRKRIAKAILDLYQANDVFVNGWKVYDRSLGSAALDNPQALLTGLFEIRLLGWERRPEVTITQAEPMPFTLLGLDLEVEGTP